MKRFLIHTKDVIYPVKARNRREAWARFFKDIADGKIPLENVGQIAILKDGKEEYPFRTLPSLWLLGVFDLETTIVNLKLVTGIRDDVEALKMLSKLAKEDKWIIKAVKELKAHG